MSRPGTGRGVHDDAGSFGTAADGDRGRFYHRGFPCSASGGRHEVGSQPVGGAGKPGPAGVAHQMVPAGDQQVLGPRRGAGEYGAIGRAWDRVALTVDHPQRLSDLAGYVGDVDLTGELLGGPLAAGPDRTSTAPLVAPGITSHSPSTTRSG